MSMDCGHKLRTQEPKTVHKCIRNTHRSSLSLGRKFTYHMKLLHFLRPKLRVILRIAMQEIQYKEQIQRFRSVWTMRSCFVDLLGMDLCWRVDILYFQVDNSACQNYLTVMTTKSRRQEMILQLLESPPNRKV